MTLEFYLAEVSFEGRKEFVVSDDLKELKQKVFHELVNKSLNEGYRSVSRFDVSNSEDYISEYDPEDYQDKIDEVINYLRSKDIDAEAVFITMRANSEGDTVNELDWDYA